MMRIVLVALLCGCAAAPVTSGEVEVIVVDRDEDDEFALVPRVLDLESVSPLVSEHFELIAGATLSTEDGALVPHGGAPLAPAYSGSEPIVPSDYESLVAFSAIHRYEQGYRFYEMLGVGGEVPAPERYRVFLYPRYQDTLLPVTLYADNASFAPDIPGFLVAREQQTSGTVPVILSPSVAVHELGHAVVHHLLVTARGRSERPAALGHFWMRALNEGISDTFAAAATGSPSVLADSFSASYATAIEARDLTRDWRLTPELEEDAEAQRISIYVIGTLVARTFWLYAELTAGRHGGHREAMLVAAQLAFDALRTFEPVLGEHAVSFFDHLLGELAEESADRAPLCEALRVTFEPVIDQVEPCR